MTLQLKEWWEAEYYDGTVISEHAGHTYDTIDRANLKTFRLVTHSGPVFELETDSIRTGWHLAYRRRVTLGYKVAYVAGWIPYGPVVAYLPAEGKVGYSDRFVPGDAIFYPPVPDRTSNERWTSPNAPNIVNPSFERTIQ